MTQSRVWDFAAFLTQGRTKTQAADLWSPGIYGGFDPLILSSALFQLNAGSLLLPNGVLTVESTPVEVAYAASWPPGVPTDYTVTADHSDVQAVGGSPVTYTMREGLLPRSGSPAASSLAVVWIRHTGTGPLTASMFSSPATVKNGEVADELSSSLAFLQAPFVAMFDLVKGSNILLTNISHASGAQHLGTKIQNTASTGAQTLTFRVPMPPLPWARSVELYADLPTNATVSLSAGAYVMKAQDGSTVATTPSTLAGPVVGLATPVGTFAVGNATAIPASMGVTVSVPAASTVFLKGFRLIGD